MKTRWQDPEWRTAELAHYRAAKARVQASVKEARHRLAIELAELAEVEAEHELELARIASFERSPPPPSRMTAKRQREWFATLDERERLVRVAAAKLELARDRFSRELGRGSSYDPELRKREHEAERNAQALAASIEGRS